MGTQTTSTNRLRRLMLVPVIVLGVVSIFGYIKPFGGNNHNNNDGNGTPRLTLLTDLGFPDFCAFQDGLTPWKDIVVDTQKLSLDVNDEEGRYAIACTGNDRGARKGFYLKGTLGEINTIYQRFDATDTTDDFTISGTVDNAVSAELAIGYNFKTNKLLLPVAGSYVYHYTQDADDSTVRDFYMRGNNFGVDHDVVKRGLDVATNPTGVNNTLVPEQSVDHFDNDLTAVKGVDPRYMDFRVKAFFNGTKVELVNDVGNPDLNIAGDKLAAGQRQSTDFYHAGIRGSEDLAADLSQRTAVFGTYINPGNQTWSGLPDRAPDVLIYDTPGFSSFTAEFSAAYDPGTAVSGLAEKLMKVETANPAISWQMWKTWGRMDLTANYILQFDEEVTQLPGFDANDDPDPASQDEVTTTLWGSNQSVGGTYDYLEDDQSNENAIDNADYWRISIRQTF